MKPFFVIPNDAMFHSARREWEGIRANAMTTTTTDLLLLLFPPLASPLGLVQQLVVSLPLLVLVVSACTHFKMFL